MSKRDSNRLLRHELGHLHQDRFTTTRSTHNLNPSIDPARQRPGVRP